MQSKMNVGVIIKSSILVNEVVRHKILFSADFVDKNTEFTNHFLIIIL